jgi:hypothetical protein
MTRDTAEQRQKRRGARAFAAFLLLWVIVLPPRPAAAQFYCEMPFVPWIAVYILIQIQDAAVDAAFAPPSGLLAIAMDKLTQETQNITAGNASIDGDDLFNLVPGLNTNIPGLDIITAPISAVTGCDSISSIGDALKCAVGSAANVAGTGFNFGGIGYMDKTMRGRLDAFWNALRAALAGMTTQIYSSGLNNARMIASIDDAGSMSSGGTDQQDREIDEKIQHVVSDQSCQFDTMAQSLGAAQALSTAVVAG